jgi:hypothetical protein
VPPDGGPRLAFQRTEAAVPAWKAGAIVHVDVVVDDLDAAARDLVVLGARPLTEEPEDGCLVFADPAGHSLCFRLVEGG